MRWANYISVAALLCSQPAFADAISAGHKALAKGDYDKALVKYKQSDTPEAKFKIGQIAKMGRVKGCDLECAGRYFAAAGDAGYVPGITALGRLYLESNLRPQALELLRLAARWNDIEGRMLLKSIQEDVPEPDLYNTWAAQQQQQEAAQAQARAQRQQALRNILEIGLLAGAAAWSAQQQGRAAGAGYATSQLPQQPPRIAAPQHVPSYAPSARSSAQPYINTPPVWQPSLAQTQRQLSTASLCPDGSYVGGECRIAPDGSYVAGTPTIAPDGSYVGGTPQLAPNGKYVGGSGMFLLCPDGSYVSGKTCRLMPNGSYVGGQ